MDLIADIFGYLLRGIGLIIAGAIALFAIVILFGDEILWNFQITGHCKAFKRDKVKVKIKHTKKKGMFVEIRPQLKPEFQHKNITVFLNSVLVATIDRSSSSSSSSSASSNPITTPISIDKPKKGQILTLKIDDGNDVSGRLS